MNPGRFFMPNYMGIRNIPFNAINPSVVTSITRSPGLFSRITSGIRSVNWGGLLNNANKTLNVVNQALPLVRQAGPMVNNFKSMMKVARAFGSETMVNRNTMNNTYNTNKNLNIEGNIAKDNPIQKKEIQNDNSPNFFI